MRRNKKSPKKQAKSAQKKEQPKTVQQYEQEKAGPDPRFTYLVVVVNLVACFLVMGREIAAGNWLPELFNGTLWQITQQEA